jgi:hypothetical protein
MIVAADAAHVHSFMAAGGSLVMLAKSNRSKGGSLYG